MAFDWGSGAALISAGAGAGSLITGLGTNFFNRRRARQDEHRNHASSISAWYEDGQMTEYFDGDVVVSNDSKAAAYKVIIHFLIGKGSFTPYSHLEPHGQHVARWVVRALPPGKWKFPCPAGWRGMSAMPVVEIAFTDTGEKNWVRFGDGKLADFELDAITYYNLEEPFGYASPLPY